MKIKKYVVNNKEIADQTHILEHIGEFYETLFKTWEQKTTMEMETFFSDADIPKLSENQAKLCEEKFNCRRFIQFFEKYAKWQISR